jgi:hypothetical protein
MVKRIAHYTVRTADLICEYIALGKTLEEALKEVGYLAPTIPQFWKWLDAHEDFREKYDRARQLQADMLADRTLGFVDEVLKDPKAAAAYKVATDILRWHAAVRNRKVYHPMDNDNAKQAPLDAKKIKEEIKRLEKELGVQEAKKPKIVPMVPRVAADE